MKLIAQLKLLPTIEQHRTLKATLERCNEACNWLSTRAFESQDFRQYNLHKAHYYAMRETFGLTAQVAVRCIAKVADAYKLKNAHKTLRVFRPWSAQPYDDRILRLVPGDVANIWTLDGRQKIAFACGKHQRDLLPFRKGETDLMYIKKKWYLSCVIDIEDTSPFVPQGVLGIDFGIINLATDSTGTVFSGQHVETVRVRYAAKRAMFQKAGSRRAKRRLTTMSGKQSRFQKITNHTIAKTLVSKAERSSLSIAIEDLTHIRQGVKAKRAFRNRLYNWSFADLRTKIEYKAKRHGVPCIFIDPKFTSQQCSQCSHTARANRKGQTFTCLVCGYSANADKNGAVNIAARGALYVTRLEYFAHDRIHRAVESPSL